MNGFLDLFSQADTWEKIIEFFGLIGIGGSAVVTYIKSNRIDNRNNEVINLVEKAGSSAASAISSAEEIKSSLITLEDYKLKVKDLQSEINYIKTRHEVETKSMHDEINHLKESNIILTSDYTRAMELMDEYQKNREYLKTEIIRLEDRIRELERKLIEESSTNISLRKENSILKEEVVVLRKEVSNLRDENKQLSTELECVYAGLSDIRTRQDASENKMLEEQNAGQL